MVQFNRSTDNFFKYAVFSLLLMCFYFGTAQQVLADDAAIEQGVYEKQTFAFVNHNNEKLFAEIKLPIAEREKYPLFISMHGMGRSTSRVWEGEFKGSETVENTHQLTSAALDQGYAVIAIDARNHGTRKDPELGLRKILDQLEQGEDQNYNTMIENTVNDYSALIEFLKTVPFLDVDNITVGGYSMGAQMSLLLAAKTPSIKRVFAMVPPVNPDRQASVSPLKQAPNISDAAVYLFTSNRDQYSSQQENSDLFNQLKTDAKLNIEFNSDHILPSHYVEVFKKIWML